MIRHFFSIGKLTLLMAAFSCAMLQAQTSEGAYGWFARAGFVCGAGGTHSTIATKPTAQCGAFFAMPLLQIEAGVIGPQAHHSDFSGYLSTDTVVPFRHLIGQGRFSGTPIGVAGYTRMFETGHAFDYGIAYAHPIDSSHSLQLELRDYWAFANPNQHNVVFRVAWIVGIPD